MYVYVNGGRGVIAIESISSQCIKCDFGMEFMMVSIKIEISTTLHTINIFSPHLLVASPIVLMLIECELVRVRVRVRNRMCV